MQDDATVFIVDDDDAVLNSMRFLLDSVGLRVQTFASAREFLDTYRPDVPGCLVLDVRMPGLSGLDLQDELRQRGAELPVIIITGYGDVPMAVRAMKAGAAEFLQKPVSDQTLLDHIQAAVARDVESFRRRADRRQFAARMAQLTPREREVLEHVVAGVSGRQIAEKLGVSPKTVESHRNKIMRRLEVRSVRDLIRVVSQFEAGSGPGSAGRAEDP